MRRPHRAHGGRGLTNDFAPLGCAVGNQYNVTDLAGFKSGPGNAGFLDQLFDFGQAGEFKASANTTILADFRSELLLGFNPQAIARRQKFRDTPLAQRRRGIAGEQIAQRLKLKQPRTGVAHAIGHEIGRKIVSKIVSKRHAFRCYNAGQISVGDG